MWSLFLFALTYIKTSENKRLWSILSIDLFRQMMRDTIIEYLCWTCRMSRLYKMNFNACLYYTLTFLYIYKSKINWTRFFFWILSFLFIESRKNWKQILRRIFISESVLIEIVQSNIILIFNEHLAVIVQ